MLILILLQTVQTVFGCLFCLQTVLGGEVHNNNYNTGSDIQKCFFGMSKQLNRAYIANFFASLLLKQFAVCVKLLTFDVHRTII